jgi:hypothetical protein
MKPVVQPAGKQVGKQAIRRSRQYAGIAADDVAIQESRLRRVSATVIVGSEWMSNMHWQSLLCSETRCRVARQAFIVFSDKLASCSGTSSIVFRDKPYRVPKHDQARLSGVFHNLAGHNSYEL